MGLGPLWQTVILLVPLAIVVLVVWMVSRVLRKAGYSGWWSVTALVPLVNLVMLWMFAFADWPALRARTTRQSTP